MLHIGGLRTALYNYLFARSHGGTFVLRIEDTDQARFVPEALDDILSSLRWAGLTFDEGPSIGGPHEPYLQSMRGTVYRTYAQKLVDKGDAYYAFDTPEEIEDMKGRLREGGADSWAYGAASRMAMRNALTMDSSEVEKRLASGDPFVIRMKVPSDETIAFDDLIRGRVEIRSDELDDQVLMKSDGLPTYHLANVVDDHLMGISHVIRGEEWLPSTPKHILLYQKFGWTPPAMAHLPLILSPSGGKLSKRNAEKEGIPVSVRQYVEAGYEPEALINFLALLGWSPGDDRERFTLPELVEAFSVERVGSSGVQFDLEKLKWHNAQFIRTLPADEIGRRLGPELYRLGRTLDPATVVEAAELMRDRITFVADVVRDAPFLFDPPSGYDADLVARRWKGDATNGLLLSLAERFGSVPTEWNPSGIEDALKEIAGDLGVKQGELMMPLRIALSGTGAGPSVVGMLALLGRNESVHRIRDAVERLSTTSGIS